MRVAELLTSLPLWKRPSTCNGMNSWLWSRECLISLEYIHACGAGNAFLWSTTMLQRMPHYNGKHSFLWCGKCLVSEVSQCSIMMKVCLPEQSKQNMSSMAMALAWMASSGSGLSSFSRASSKTEFPPITI